MHLIHQLALSILKAFAYVSVIFIGTFWIFRGTFPTPEDVKKTVHEMRDLQEMTTSTLKVYKQKQSTVKNGTETVREDLAAVESELNSTAGKGMRMAAPRTVGTNDSEALNDIKKQLSQIQSQLNDIQYQLNKTRR